MKKTKEELMNIPIEDLTQDEADKLLNDTE